MRRVAITGLGITSCLGNDADTVSAALREGRSGIRHIPQYAELGFRSQVGGAPEIDLEAQIDRKQKRFMGDAAAFAHIALRDAIADAGARATAAAPLAWLSLEPPDAGVVFDLRLTLWPGGESRRLATSHPHGREVTWL